MRVLDFTHAAAGPFATMFLADLGADVIKIERPGRGDGSRYMGAPMLGPLDSDYYVALNRSKRDLLVDLREPAGVALVRQLAGRCDVVVQNFRPGVADRLGIGYDQLRGVRQGLVYCSISAFGSVGAWAGRPANDIIMQSVSGLMGITGERDGAPVRIGAPISDFSTGLFALVGVLAALAVRDQHPQGQHVEVSMLHSSLAMMANYLPSVVTLGARIPRLGRGHAQIAPYDAFQCADGGHVMVGAFTNGFWRNLCAAVDRPSWPTDERFARNADRVRNRDVLLPLLAEIFATRPRDEWLAVLEAHDVPCSPVLELDEAVRLPQVADIGALVHLDQDGRSLDVIGLPVRVDHWRPRPAAVPPRMGQHTDEVLREVLGLTTEEIDDLVERKVVGRMDVAHAR